MRPLRVLTFTSVFPNPAQPRHGVPVWERLRHMVESGAVAARVLAPVPWFPVSHRMFGSWAKFASIPSAEAREGVAVMHPRYPVIPKIGMGLAPWLMASAVRRLFRELASDAERRPVGAIA